MRYLFGLALLIALTASLARGPERPPFVRMTPVPLDRDHPGRREFGALVWLGSWKLDSNVRAFGGISSMHIDKGQVLALSDAARSFRFSLNGDSLESRLATSPLPGIFLPGLEQPDRDSEAMAIAPETGRTWVSFETSNAIRTFTAGLEAKKGWVAPPAMARWPENSGAEAMVRLRDGRFVIFSESAPGPDGSFEALLFAGNPLRHARDPVLFHYQPPRGFQATDAAELPDGRLLVLNRHFSVFDGVAAALTIIDPAEIRQGAVMAGREIARLAPPLNVDNMEALSIETDERGRNIVWLASDDNFNPLQQTLLMRFALDIQRAR